MTIVQTGVDAVKQIVLDHFDTFNYGAIGTGSTTALSSDTILETETFRELVYSTNKLLSEGVYIFTIYLTTIEGNVLIKEIGIFDANTGGNIALRNNIGTDYTKLSSEEIRIQVAINVEVTV